MAKNDWEFRGVCGECRGGDICPGPLYIWETIFAGPALNCSLAGRVRIVLDRVRPIGILGAVSLSVIAEYGAGITDCGLGRRPPPNATDLARCRIDVPLASFAGGGGGRSLSVFAEGLKSDD